MKTKKLKKEVDKTIKYLCKEIRNDKCYYEYKDSIGGMCRDRDIDRHQNEECSVRNQHIKKL